MKTRQSKTKKTAASRTICDQCGAKWADDEGGVPHDAHEYPKPIRDAQDMLAPRDSDKNARGVS